MKATIFTHEFSRKFQALLILIILFNFCSSIFTHSRIHDTDAMIISGSVYAKKLHTSVRKHLNERSKKKHTHTHTERAQKQWKNILSDYKYK